MFSVLNWTRISSDLDYDLDSNEPVSTTTQYLQQRKQKINVIFLCTISKLNKLICDTDHVTLCMSPLLFFVIKAKTNTNAN